METDCQSSTRGPVVGVWQLGLEQCQATRFASWSFTNCEKSSRRILQWLLVEMYGRALDGTWSARQTMIASYSRAKRHVGKGLATKGQATLGELVT